MEAHFSCAARGCQGRIARRFAATRMAFALDADRPSRRKSSRIDEIEGELKLGGSAGNRMAWMIAPTAWISALMSFASGCSRCSFDPPWAISSRSVLVDNAEHNVAVASRLQRTGASRGLHAFAGGRLAVVAGPSSLRQFSGQAISIRFCPPGSTVVDRTSVDSSSVQTSCRDAGSSSGRQARASALISTSSPRSRRRAIVRYRHSATSSLDAPARRPSSSSDSLVRSPLVASSADRWRAPHAEFGWWSAPQPSSIGSSSGASADCPSRRPCS